MQNETLVYLDQVESKITILYLEKSYTYVLIDALYKDFGGTSEYFFKLEEMEFIGTISYES